MYLILMPSARFRPLLDSVRIRLWSVNGRHQIDF